MESKDKIFGFSEIFESKQDILTKNKVREKNFLLMDLVDISKRNKDLAEEILNNPRDTLKAAEIAISQIELFKSDKFRLRVSDSHNFALIKPRDLRTKHLEKFINITGIVRQKTDVRPETKAAKFECPTCGAVISVLQLESTFREPNKCSCGRKGKFRLLEKNMIDAQGIALEECPEIMEGNEQPKRINLWLSGDLCLPMEDKQTNPGTKIKVTGILKEIPIIINGSRSVRSDFLVEVNNVNAEIEDYTQVSISKEDMQRIKDISQSENLYETLVNSLCPKVFGHKLIKEALLLQLFGGVRKENEGNKTRGDIHILLIGDPGTAKSKMLKRIQHISPKAKYATGPSSSGVGLTVSVVKDDFLKGWALEAGALVMANKGICIVDELDKMSKEDSDHMHEALEQQTVTINKAGINATLNSQTALLAGANPKYGRFSDYDDNIFKQIDLSSSLINRFDMIFIIKDIPDTEKDERLASFIMKLHAGKLQHESIIETKILRKYIAYARQMIKPILGPDAEQEIKRFYLELRNNSTKKTIQIGPRQLEALIRMTEASAKTRLSNIATVSDAKTAIRLVRASFEETCKSQGGYDIDIIETGDNFGINEKRKKVENTIREMEEANPKCIVDTDELQKRCNDLGINAEEVDKILDLLKEKSAIFYPRRNKIKRL